MRTVLVANRGEIAVRIFRTLRRMGIRPVGVYAAGDDFHVRSTGVEAVLLPGGYLDVEGVVAAAVSSGADGLHPGYGFLSENHSLAAACERAGVIFIGPPASAIEAMGDKINAKALVSAAGVPVVPGRDGRGLSEEELGRAAMEVGLPVLLKPSAGGGGKGMHRVDRAEDLDASIATARREATTAFGDGTLLVERFVTRPRHIEIQVLADRHGRVVALGERECSLQRRHQKIVEESPSPLLDPATRRAMEEAAVAAARAVDYTGAGTVEFIVSAERPGEFFFMEMNTRLQVEHPVTEMVRGVDLVEWQVRVAAGEPLDEQVSSAPRRGHAVEARVYAEAPARGFLPATGTVVHYHEPTARHVRVDSGVGPGSVIGTGYDPMLAKVIAWGSDRGEALARLRDALAEMAIVGVTTNVGFLRRLLAEPRVLAGDIDTALVAEVQSALAAPPDEDWVATTAAQIEAATTAAGTGPWDIADGWRIGDPAPRRSRWRIDDRSVEVSLPEPGTAVRLDGPEGRVEAEGRAFSILWARDGDLVHLWRGGDSWEAVLERETIDHAGPASAGAGPVSSPMPGTVLAVHASAGDTVRRGQPLVTVEAMKMEHVVAAPVDGTLSRLLVAAGQSVALGQALAEVEQG